MYNYYGKINLVRDLEFDNENNKYVFTDIILGKGYLISSHKSNLKTIQFMEINNKNIMFIGENLVLIKKSELPTSWEVRYKSDSMTIYMFDNTQEVEKLVKELLDLDVEKFDSEEDFFKKYPNLTKEERFASGMEYWKENIPMDKWPKEVYDFLNK